jgi:hypothetical protein
MQRGSAVTKRTNDLLQRTRNASAHVVYVRSAARTEAIRAIRELEKALQAALDGDTIRGLPDALSFRHDPPLQALRVGSESNWLPLDGRAVLILSRRGELCMAHVVGKAGYESYPVLDSELRAQDLKHVTRTVQKALEGHLAHTQLVAANYETTSALAQTLAKAVGFRL